MTHTHTMKILCKCRSWMLQLLTSSRQATSDTHQPYSWPKPQTDARRRCRVRTQTHTAPRAFGGKWGATSRYMKGNDVYYAGARSHFVYGGFMAAYFGTVQSRSWSSIIIVASLTLGPVMIDGELLMTLGWNCYYHKSDTQYLNTWCLQMGIVWREHSHLSSDYC